MPNGPRPREPEPSSGTSSESVQYNETNKLPPEETFHLLNSFPRPYNLTGFDFCEGVGNNTTASHQVSPFPNEEDFF